MVSVLFNSFVAVLAILPAITAIPTITTKGSKFFTSDGNQFFIKGIHSTIHVHSNLLID